MGPGPVWTGAENLAPIRIRSPDRSIRSESLYRLSYSGSDNHVILFCLLYYVMLCYIILCFIILYYIALFYTILFYNLFYVIHNYIIFFIICFKLHYIILTAYGSYGGVDQWDFFFFVVLV